MVKRILILVGLMTVLSGCINIPIPLGDGTKLMVGTDGISFVDDDQEYKFDIDEDEGTFSLDGVDGDDFSISKDEDGGVSLTITDEDGTTFESQMGDNLDLSFELPEGVPLPDHANIHQQMDLGAQLLVVFTVDQSINEMKEFYSSYFSGSFADGPIVTDTGLTGYVEKFIAATDEYEINVQITGQEGKDESNVAIDIYHILDYYGEDYDFDYMYNYDYGDDDY